MEMVSFLQPWFLERKGLAGAAFRNLLVVVDGGGAVPATGIYGDVTLDFDCTIVGWTLLARESGSLQLDLWKAPFVAFPPTVANTITGATPPTLTATDHNRSADVSDWTTAWTAGDCVRVNIDSVSAVTRATLAIHLSG